jgi:hypothetical protein
MRAKPGMQKEIILEQVMGHSGIPLTPGFSQVNLRSRRYETVSTVSNFPPSLARYRSGASAERRHLSAAAAITRRRIVVLAGNFSTCRAEFSGLTSGRLKCRMRLPLWTPLTYRCQNGTMEKWNGL